MRALDQECAQKALTAVNEMCNSTDTLKFAKKLPMLIINSGLCNALLFAHNKNHSNLVVNILKWLLGDDNIAINNINDIIDKKLLSDRNMLRLYTVKALKYLEWFNKFAATKIKEEN